MSALTTAEAAMRRAPDDPAVPITISGAEAAALIAELDRARGEADHFADVGLAEQTARREVQARHQRAREYLTSLLGDGLVEPPPMVRHALAILDGTDD